MNEFTMCERLRCGQQTSYKFLANICLELRPKSSETVTSAYKLWKTVPYGGGAG